MTPNSEVEECATVWLMRQEEAGWSAVDQTALDAWLDESFSHRASYWRLEHGWRAADRLKSLGRSEAVANEARRRPARRLRDLALAAALVGLIAVPAGLERLGPKRIDAIDFSTPVGGHVILPMADGSKIELNTATHVRASVSREHREVWLDRGEAFFEVVHLPDFPFVVHAGSRTITVLGTKFSVRRDGDKVIVAVVEGRVRIDGNAPLEQQRSSTVTKGDIVVARDASTLVAASSSAGVESMLSWRDGMLDLNRSTLADAATEFNRYNRKKIVIDDPEIGRIRLGGMIRADNVEGFIGLLRTAYGLRIESNDDTITISS